MIDVDQRLQSSGAGEDPTGSDPAGRREAQQAGYHAELSNHHATTGLSDAILCEMQHRLLDSEENERQRLAQELHDGPLQELHSLDFKLVAMAHQVSEDQQQAQLGEMRATLRQLARHLRAICQDLRPPALAPFGVSAVLRSFAETFQLNHRDLTVVVDLDDDGQCLSERARLALYRICQHALRNVAQHAVAARVYVGLRLGEDYVQMCIEDNGRGFVVPDDWLPMVEQGKYGLLGCIERAAAVGGHVTVESEPGNGTRLRVIVPFVLAPSPSSEETQPAGD